MTEEKNTAKQTPKKIHAVRLDDVGVRACGPYKRGEIYLVGESLSLEEANRLVDVKGFRALTAAQITAAEKNSNAAGEG